MRYLALAGDRAFDAGAYDEAARQFDAAPALREGGDPTEVVALHERSARALRSGGRAEGAVKEWRAALGLYEQIGDTAGLARVMDGLGNTLAWSAGDAGIDEAWSISQRLLRSMDAADPGRAQILAIAAFMGSARGDSAAESMLDEAAALAEQQDDAELLARVLGARAGYCWQFVRAREGAENGCAPPSCCGRLTSRGGWPTACGRPRRVSTAEASWPCSTRSATSFGRWHAVWDTKAPFGSMTSSVWRECSIGRSRSVRWRKRRWRIWSWRTWVRTRSPITAIRFVAGIRFRQGRWDDADALLAKSIAAQTGGAWEGIGLGLLSLYAAYRGDPAPFARLREQSGLLPEPGRPNTVGQWYVLASTIRSAVVLGEPGIAGELYALTLEAIANDFLQSVAAGL